MKQKTLQNWANHESTGRSSQKIELGVPSDRLVVKLMLLASLSGGPAEGLQIYVVSVRIVLSKPPIEMGSLHVSPSACITEDFGADTKSI